MRADHDYHPGDPPLEATLARLRRATDAIEPPPGYAARVLAQALDPGRLPPVSDGRASAKPPSQASVWAHLGPVGRRFVPAAMLAAAAALALAWSAQEHLDENVDSALELAQGLP
jgi:hypothetical protein